MGKNTKQKRSGSSPGAIGKASLQSPAPSNKSTVTRHPESRTTQSSDKEVFQQRLSNNTTKPRPYLFYPLTRCEVKTQDEINKWNKQEPSSGLEGQQAADARAKNLETTTTLPRSKNSNSTRSKSNRISNQRSGNKTHQGETTKGEYCQQNCERCVTCRNNHNIRNRLGSKLTKLAAIFKGSKKCVQMKTPCECCACEKSRPEAVETSRLYVEQMARANASCNNKNGDCSKQRSSINSVDYKDRMQNPHHNFTITSSSGTTGVIPIREQIQSPTPTEDKEESSIARIVPDMGRGTRNVTSSKEKSLLHTEPVSVATSELQNVGEQPVSTAEMRRRSTRAPNRRPKSARTGKPDFRSPQQSTLDLLSTEIISAAQDQPTEQSKVQAVRTYECREKGTVNMFRINSDHTKNDTTQTSAASIRNLKGNDTETHQSVVVTHPRVGCSQYGRKKAGNKISLSKQTVESCSHETQNQQVQPQSRRHLVAIKSIGMACGEPSASNISKSDSSRSDLTTSTVTTKTPSSQCNKEIQKSRSTFYDASSVRSSVKQMPTFEFSERVLPIEDSARAMKPSSNGHQLTSAQTSSTEKYTTGRFFSNSSTALGFTEKNNKKPTSVRNVSNGTSEQTQYSWNTDAHALPGTSGMMSVKQMCALFDATSSSTTSPAPPKAPPGRRDEKRCNEGTGRSRGTSQQTSVDEN